MKKILPFLAVLVVLSGCSRSLSQRVGTAAVVYETSTNSMTVLARSGNLSLDKAEKFETYRAPAKQYLDIALDDLLDGDGNDDRAENALDILIPILDQLIEANREATNE